MICLGLVCYEYPADLFDRPDPRRLGTPSQPVICLHRDWQWPVPGSLRMRWLAGDVIHVREPEFLVLDGLAVFGCVEWLQRDLPETWPQVLAQLERVALRLGQGGGGGHAPSVPPDA